MATELGPSLASASDDGVWTVAWVGGGGGLLTGSVDELVKSWKVGEGGITGGASLSPGHNLGVLSLSASADASVCSSSGLDGQICIWRADEGAQTEHARTIDAGPGECWTVAMHPEASVVLSGTQHGAVHAFSVQTGERTESYKAKHSKWVLAVACSPDGKRLACGSTEGVVSVFDIASGTLVHEVSASTLPVRTVAFSADSAQLYAGADDASYSVWDVLTGERIDSVAAHAGWVLAIACAPNGLHYATSSADRQVKIWDARTRTALRSHDGVHTDHVWALAYEGSTGRLASGGDDGRVQVYVDAAPAEQVAS